MKIRHPWLIRVASFLASRFVRVLIATLRFRYEALGPYFTPELLAGPDRYLFTAWHENLLLLACRFARPDIHVMISQHADGELISQTVQKLGYSVVRGSSTRGGIQAVRQCLRTAAGGHLGVTPDGPRGPRRRVQDGLIYLAARTGLPIMPVGVGYCRPWRAKSWDRFAVPRPWSRACSITGRPIFVPAETERADIDKYRVQVEAALEQLGEIAEHWANTGTWPEDCVKDVAA